MDEIITRDQVRIQNLEDKIAALTSALSDAKRDLEKYGGHLMDCPQNLIGGVLGKITDPCLCGFYEAPKRLGSVK